MEPSPHTIARTRTNSRRPTGLAHGQRYPTKVELMRKTVTWFGHGLTGGFFIHHGADLMAKDATNKTALDLSREPRPVQG
jgi:hypothetical protein